MGPADKRYALAAIIGLIAVMAILYAGLGIGALPAYFIAINLVTLLAYGYDKKIAGSSILRVPERVLHALALLGGSIGALAAQRWFRHKTVKQSFRIVYWLIVLVQIVLVAIHFYVRYF